MFDAVAGLLPAKIALIAGAGIGAQWLAWRMQWPAVVLLAAAGLILGPVAAIVFGAPAVDPAHDFGALLRPMIAVAVAVILFEGGLNLNLIDLRGAGAARRLALLGAPVAMVLGAVAGHVIAGLEWDVAFLFGGLMAMTGAAVVTPLLRHARLSGGAGALLRWEGVLNEPLGALLAVFVFEAIYMLAGGGSWFGAAAAIVFGALIGAVFGAICGLAMAWAFRRGHVPEYLKGPLVLAAVLGVFVLADLVAQETGLLAVAAFGMTMGNSRLASVEEMRRFKESIAIILVSGAVIMLAASLAPSFPGVIGARMVVFIIVMMAVVRPLSVLIASAGSGLTWKERAVVAWMAPRGVAALVIAGYFALELTAIGRPDGAAIAPLALLMVFATVLAHGFSIGPLARRLGLARGAAEGVLIVGSTAWSAGLAAALQELGAPVTVADSSYRRLRPARDAGIASYIGEVLSEQAGHRLDHASIGHLVAAGPNDAYNALVCVQFAPELGRHRVWQLAVPEESVDSRTISYTSRGAALIGPRRSFESLAQDWWAGWRFRATRISEAYSLDQLRADRPDSDLVAELRPDGALAFIGDGSPPRGLPGSIVVTFGPPRAETQPAPAPEAAERAA